MSPDLGADVPARIRRRQRQRRSGAEPTENRRHLMRERPGSSASQWRIRDVQNMAKVPTAIAGSTTLGVAVGPRQYIVDQLWAEADVIRAIHERVQLCQDPQTEFALLRESLGVSHINHILREHGHTIIQEQRAATTLGSGLSNGSSRVSRRTV